MTSEPGMLIFTCPDCEYCSQAKALLNEQDVDFEERSIANVYNWQDLLVRLPTVRSMPQLFIDGLSIGGSEDLQRLIQRDELALLLYQSGGS